MLQLVFRRMLSSRWMIICLLLGSIMATALVSCIPIYTDGILQRMLTKDLENFQLRSGTFPGQYTVKSSFNYNYQPEQRVKAYQYFNSRIMSENIRAFGLPILEQSQEVKLGNLYMPVDETDGVFKDLYAQLGAVSGLDEHVSITNGRMYSGKLEDGVIEVIVSQSAMKQLNLLLDREYTLTDPQSKGEPVCRVKVVGVFEMKNPGDVYWYKGLNQYSKEFIMDFGLFNERFIKTESRLLTEAQWFCAFDYHSITLRNISNITDTYDEQVRWYQKYKGSMEPSMSSITILREYAERAAQLKTMLWVLTIPVLIMLTFYIFMVSQLIVNNDENGIAVLKSRGASRGQIFLSYLVESLIIGAVALIFGPPLGIVICKILGSSNGFLEFVQRTALPVALNTKVYSYSLAAVAFLIATMLIPVVIASRLSIVNYKQARARSAKTPLWKKYFLDVLIMAASGYGLYRYNQQQEILSTTAAKASEIRIDPLLFLTSTLFVLGAGLLFLRLYPYIVRFVYWLGRGLWSPVLYISLIQVGRSKGQEQFLMLFIILAISTGIFNANSARTINRNIEDKIRYSIGADITLQANWPNNKPLPTSGPPTAEDLKRQAEPVKYIEPDFNRFSTLSGTDAATKVLTVDQGTAMTDADYLKNIKIMGIIPDEFARIAWFRPDLLPYHWYYYLNMMADAPKAFLVSANLKEKYKLREGDTIYVTWGDQNPIEGTVYGFVDYWPTYNPHSDGMTKDEPGLVVANFSYLWNKTATQPYEVWIKKQPGATDTQFNEDIIKKDLNLLEINYTNQQVIKAKNDPMLQGTNGALSLGFIAAMLISMLGFLIYWIISIQSRVLQFGILRAMGLSLSRVIGMLACEQILVSGAAILVGLIIGGVTGDTFIPLLQIVYSSADQVPPFRIVANADDYIKIYAVIAAMLLIGFAALWRLISKIRIDQAVKLGED
jgi:putative ABC transport system permease protein